MRPTHVRLPMINSGFVVYGFHWDAKGKEGEGVAFHSFIEKARTFIPKSSYLRIRFFDVSGLCFSVPGWCILGLSNPLAFGMVLGGPFRLAPLLGSFVCQRKPLRGAQGSSKIGHTMEGVRGLLWASAGC